MDLSIGIQARFLLRISPVINECCKAIINQERKLEILKIEMEIREKQISLDISFKDSSMDINLSFSIMMALGFESDS